MTNDTMRKTIPSQDVRMKAVKNELGHMQFEGYLAVFNNIDRAGDIIRPGAFKNTLAEAKEKNKTFPIIEMHDMWQQPIGYFLELKEDDYGLWVKGQLFSTDLGKNIHTILKESPEGSIGMSIGYRIVKMTATNKDNPGAALADGSRYYLDELKLKEGSIVYSIPCNELAVVNDVKSQSMEKRKVEKLLKDKGLSTKDAQIAVSVMFELNEEEKHTMTTEEFYKTQYVKDNSDFQNLGEYEGLKKLASILDSVEKTVDEKEVSDSLLNLTKSFEDITKSMKDLAKEQQLKKITESLGKLLTN